MSSMVPTNTEQPRCQHLEHDAKGNPVGSACGEPATHQLIAEGEPGWVFCPEHVFDTEAPVVIDGVEYELDARFVPITDA